MSIAAKHFTNVDTFPSSNGYTEADLGLLQDPRCSVL